MERLVVPGDVNVDGQCDELETVSVTSLSHWQSASVGMRHCVAQLCQSILSLLKIVAIQVDNSLQARPGRQQNVNLTLKI